MVCILLPRPSSTLSYHLCSAHMKQLLFAFRPTPTNASHLFCALLLTDSTFNKPLVCCGALSRWSRWAAMSCSLSPSYAKSSASPRTQRSCSTRYERNPYHMPKRVCSQCRQAASQGTCLAALFGPRVLPLTFVPRPTLCPPPPFLQSVTTGRH